LTSKTDKYFAEHKPFEGLGRASARSGVTLVVARAINAVVQVATMVLLARLLSPQDYGLVGVVTAMVTVAPLLVDLGTSEASLQKAHASRGEVRALFWLNIAVGGACTIIFAAISGLIASVFKEPAMAGIALASSLTFILTAMTVQHYALMRRAMDFRAIAINDTIANMLGSVTAIAMAFGPWGYWALVAKPLVTLTFTAIGAWISCPWLPGRP
jgi:PST family polysaccharide transporter